MKRRRLSITTDEDCQRAQSYLYQLCDEDPTRAVAEAQQLQGKGPVYLPAQSLRAGIFIDAGGRTGDSQVVREGIKILRKLTRKASEEPVIRYNLANGLSQLAKLKTFSGPEWYISTHSQRREARRLYYEVASLHFAIAPYPRYFSLHGYSGLCSLWS